MKMWEHFNIIELYVKHFLKSMSIRNILLKTCHQKKKKISQKKFVYNFYCNFIF